MPKGNPKDMNTEDLKIQLPNMVKFIAGLISVLFTIYLTVGKAVSHSLEKMQTEINDLKTNQIKQGNDVLFMQQKNEFEHERLNGKIATVQEDIKVLKSATSYEAAKYTPNSR